MSGRLGLAIFHDPPLLGRTRERSGDRLYPGNTKGGVAALRAWAPELYWTDAWCCFIEDCVDVTMRELRVTAGIVTVGCHAPEEGEKGQEGPGHGGRESRVLGEVRGLSILRTGF